MLIPRDALGVDSRDPTRKLAGETRTGTWVWRCSNLVMGARAGKAWSVNTETSRREV